MKERKSGINAASVLVVAVVLVITVLGGYNLLGRGASSGITTSASAGPNTPFQATAANTTLGCENPPGTCVIDEATGCPAAGPIQVSAGQRCTSIPATIQVVITDINGGCVGNDYLLVQVPSGIVTYEAVWVDQYGSRWWSSPGTTYPNSITGEGGVEYNVTEGDAGWSVGGGAGAVGECTGPPGGTDAIAWAISNSTFASTSTSTLSSTPSTPPPVVPGIGLSTIEIAAIITGVIAIAGGLGWYYYQNSGDGGDASCSGGGPPPSGPGGGCTVSCTPCLPVACGHATRTPVTVNCLTKACGPTVDCTTCGSATAHRTSVTVCSIARACAPPAACGTATAHRVPQSVCSLAASQCTPPGGCSHAVRCTIEVNSLEQASCAPTCGTAHGTREVASPACLTVVRGPSVDCSAATGHATRTPQTTSCVQVVSGPSVTCTTSGEATAHRDAECVTALTRATCSQSAHATRCVTTVNCSLARAQNPQSNPCGTGTAVRTQIGCQPVAKVRPSTQCGTSTATRTPCSVQGSVKVVKQPSSADNECATCSSTAEDAQPSCG